MDLLGLLAPTGHLSTSRASHAQIALIAELWSARAADGSRLQVVLALEGQARILVGEDWHFEVIDHAGVLAGERLPGGALEIRPYPAWAQLLRAEIGHLPD